MPMLHLASARTRRFLPRFLSAARRNVQQPPIMSLLISRRISVSASHLLSLIILLLRALRPRRRQLPRPMLPPAHRLCPHPKLLPQLRLPQSRLLQLLPPSATSSMSAQSTTTSATVETTGTSTKSSLPSSTSDSAASATSSSAATEGSASKGLSQAAIAGIGVGIGAAVIAIAGIVICMLLKARRRKPGRHGHNKDISKPLPGPDRMYAQRDTNFRRDRDHSMEKFGNDLEMTSHRYEDMVPRTQPRTLV
ncbi:hypothetical protein J3458_004982 [Metarhizium acridum]|uniref:uncharacterized protein n=1 Tax=Metarhizium acridum TaxID=92637 RepID=UPI001C6CFE3E|nr:hypothetical protein J3458_004982 [Metarhizium acridum]